MLLPMAFLAALCLALSLGGPLLLAPLDRVLAVLAPGNAPQLRAGLGHDMRLIAAMAALLLVLGTGCALWLRRRQAPSVPTWDCGYAQPNARMQYTSTSFSDGWAALVPGLKSRVRRIRQVFPGPTSFRSEFRDAVGEGFVEDRTERLARRLQGFRRLQQGQLPVYLLYILGTLVAGFLWMLLRPRILG
jgi:hypothetical protein